jgi:hypothetical protein
MAVAADMVFQATDIIRRLPSTPATAPDFSISLDGISAFPEAILMSILKGC